MPGFGMERSIPLFPFQIDFFNSKNGGGGARTQNVPKLGASMVVQHAHAHNSRKAGLSSLLSVGRLGVSRQTPQAALALAM